MNQMVSPDILELIETIKYRPAVSLILPFEPKMDPKTEIIHSLKIAAGKVEKELSDNYPGEIASLVMQRLRNCIKNLNFNTHKKSIAIYVSPLFEKTLYLEIPVEEKVIVDESFEIRDLVYCKKELHKYLLLLLNSNGCKMFVGNTDSFIKIISNSPEAICANDPPERVADFSDITKRKEILMDKFLHHTDNRLDIILRAYPLPLFVLGTEKITGHFKSITKHSSAVIEYVHGNYEEASTDELREILQPYVSDWKKIKQMALLNKLEDAAGNRKLATGISDVWKLAANKNGRLLAVEKNYTCAAIHGGSKDLIYEEMQSANNFPAIKDAVDDVIEKVLGNGGDVEFTDAGILENYCHIALIQY